MRLVKILAILFLGISAEAQVCTALTSGNWSGGPPGDRATWSCGNPNTFSGTIVIPAGITVTINNNTTWNANVEVRGTLLLDNQLTLGTTSGCGYTLRIFDSGVLTRPAGPDASDRLIICGTTIITSQPGPPAGTLPWPPGGYDSSTPGGGFGENGPLPVTLIFFHSKVVGGNIELRWATSRKKDLTTLIWNAVDGYNYSSIEVLSGAGYNSASYKCAAHSTPLNGAYYRLKAVDLDGSYEYFG